MKPPDPNVMLYIAGLGMIGMVCWLIWAFTVMAHRWPG